MATATCGNSRKRRRANPREQTAVSTDSVGRLKGPICRLGVLRQLRHRTTRFENRWNNGAVETCLPPVILSIN